MLREVGGKTVNSSDGLEQTKKSVKGLRQWVKLPSAWIIEDKLKDFQWGKGGSDNTAALMVLLVVAHHADPDSGVAHLTFDQLEVLLEISRTKITAGVSRLVTAGLLSKPTRSSYSLTAYNPEKGWAKLPAKKLYHGGAVSMFRDFRLRRREEMDALKLYLLLIGFRDNVSNTTSISYDVIEQRSGIIRNNIKTAISVLATHGLVHVERRVSSASEWGVSAHYRIAFLDPYNHEGTRGRSTLPIADDMETF